MHYHEDLKHIDTTKMSVRELTGLEWRNPQPCYYCPNVGWIALAQLVVTYPDGQERFICTHCRNKDPVVRQVKAATPDR